jgi:hypothetical protein
MRWSELTRESPDLGKESRRDANFGLAQPDLARAAARGAIYQVTSPAPARTLATRASMKRRSDRRLR